MLSYQENLEQGNIHVILSFQALTLDAALDVLLRKKMRKSKDGDAHFQSIKYQAMIWSFVILIQFTMSLSPLKQLV